MRAEGGIRANVDVLAGLLLLTVTAVAYLGARGATWAVWLFPRVAAGVLGLCGLVLLGHGLRKGERVQLWAGAREIRELAAFAAGLVAYALLLPWLGFWCLTGPFLGGVAYALRRRRARELVGWLLVGVVVALAMDALFVGVFGVPLPGGVLWDDARWRPWVP